MDPITLVILKCCFKDEFARRWSMERAVKMWSLNAIRRALSSWSTSCTAKLTEIDNWKSGIESAQLRVAKAAKSSMMKAEQAAAETKVKKAQEKLTVASAAVDRAMSELRHARRESQKANSAVLNAEAELLRHVIDASRADLTRSPKGSAKAARAASRVNLERSRAFLMTDDDEPKPHEAPRTAERDGPGKVAAVNAVTAEAAIEPAKVEAVRMAEERSKKFAARAARATAEGKAAKARLQEAKKEVAAMTAAAVAVIEVPPPCETPRRSSASIQAEAAVAHLLYARLADKGSEAGAARAAWASLLVRPALRAWQAFVRKQHRRQQVVSRAAKLMTPQGRAKLAGLIAFKSLSPFWEGATASSLEVRVSTDGFVAANQAKRGQQSVHGSPLPTRGLFCLAFRAAGPRLGLVLGVSDASDTPAEGHSANMSRAWGLHLSNGAVLSVQPGSTATLSNETLLRNVVTVDGGGEPSSAVTVLEVMVDMDRRRLGFGVTGGAMIEVPDLQLPHRVRPWALFWQAGDAVMLEARRRPSRTAATSSAMLPYAQQPLVRALTSSRSDLLGVQLDGTPLTPLRCVADRSLRPPHLGWYALYNNREGQQATVSQPSAPLKPPDTKQLPTLTQCGLYLPIYMYAFDEHGALRTVENERSSPTKPAGMPHASLHQRPTPAPVPVLVTGAASDIQRDGCDDSENRGYSWDRWLPVSPASARTGSEGTQQLPQSVATLPPSAPLPPPSASAPQGTEPQPQQGRLRSSLLAFRARGGGIKGGNSNREMANDSAEALQPALPHSPSNVPHSPRPMMQNYSRPQSPRTSRARPSFHMWDVVKHVTSSYADIHRQMTAKR